MDVLELEDEDGFITQNYIIDKIYIYEFLEMLARYSILKENETRQIIRFYMLD